METNVASVKSLLEQIGPLSLKFREHEELSRAKGELFNIFTVLRLERDETTHSRLLAGLLDPKGLHGLGDVFLKLFLKLVPKHFKIQDGSFDSRTATVQVELPIGPRTDNSGGRIDIAISDAKENNIFIENKIDADDQPQQLLRYHGEDLQAPLFYLTLDGKEPSAQSTGGKNNQGKDDWYECISYERDILDWLEACKKEAVGAPLVRETTTQYINLIKELTDQTLSIKMSNQIAETVLQNPTALAAFFDLEKAHDAVLTKILERFGNACAEVSKRLSLDFRLKLNLGDCSDFYFHNEALERLGVKITIALQSQGPLQPLIGFGYLSRATTSKTPPSLKDGFREMFQNLGLKTYCDDQVNSGSWWACHARWTGLTYETIHFQHVQVQAELEDKIQKMLEVLERTSGKQ